MIDWGWLVPVGLFGFGLGMTFGLFLGTYASREEPR